MSYNITGIWTNSNKSHKDTVAILEIDESHVQIIGFGKKPRPFRNIGHGIITGDQLRVQWTDTAGSKGTALGEVHETLIQIVDEKKLQQIKDTVISPERTKETTDLNDTYGNWVKQ